MNIIALSQIAEKYNKRYVLLHYNFCDSHITEELASCKFKSCYNYRIKGKGFCFKHIENK